jgi:hypothetical protein
MRHVRLAITLILMSGSMFGQGDVQIRQPLPSTGFLKHISIESFGYNSSTPMQGYEFAPGTTSAFYNLHGLECPLCIPGPPNRSRAILPPFGAKASLGFWHDRLILFAGFGGINTAAWGNSPRISPIAMRASPDNDALLVQRRVGASVALDPEKRFSFGITHSYLNDFGPSKAAWHTTTGDVNISPEVFRDVVHSIKNVNKQLTHSDKDH